MGISLCGDFLSFLLQDSDNKFRGFFYHSTKSTFELVIGVKNDWVANLSRGFTDKEKLEVKRNIELDFYQASCLDLWKLAVTEC